MIADRLLPDLLAAERALGRLDQALSDPERAHRHRWDAARRTAAALIKLDGGYLDPHDHQLALAVPEHATGEAWRAALIGTLLAQLQAGFPAGETAVNPRRDHHPAPDARLSAAGREVFERALQADVVAAARASVAELEAFDLAAASHGAAEDDAEAESAGDAGGPPAPEPWTLDWLDALHRRWNVVQGGGAVGLDPRRRADATAALTAVHDALAGAPGLLGAAAALRVLATRADPGGLGRSGAGEDAASAALRAEHGVARPQSGWWNAVVWLAAPTLLQAACRLHVAWPPLTVAAARDVTGWRLALAGDAAAWTRWVVTTVPEMVGHELDRLRQLDLVHERWTARIAPSARRSSSRLPDLLPWLFERPAYTVTRAAPELKARFGLSLRGAHLLTEELAKAGVVRPLAGRGGERVWVTELAFLPSGR